jgi:hypothetical protein
MGGNLPVRGIFVPLLYQWLSHVCRPEPPQTTTLVGEPLFLGEVLAMQKSKAKLSTMVTFPDGSRHSFENLPTSVLTDTPQPGFYQVQQGNRTSWHAVNLDTRESDPNPMTAENFLARVTRPEEQAQSGLAGIFGVSEISQRDAEKQHKLWRLGLWALLLLLFAETWLANRTPR